MKPVIKTVMALGVSAVLSGCSWVNALNPFSDASVKPAPLVDFSPEVKLNKSWTVDVGNSEQGVFAPVAYEGAVYAASAEGFVFGIEQQTGKVRWKVKTDRKLKTGVAVTADTVVVIDVNNQVLAFDFNGKSKWKVNLETEVDSLPVGAADTILLRPIDFSVLALSSDTGTQRWTYSRQLPVLTLRIQMLVDVKNNRVFAGFPGGRLVGLDLTSGSMVWEGVLSSPKGTTEIERISDITGSPVYNFREVCAASFQGKVGCLDTTNGKAVWSADFSSPNGLSVDDRYLIAANEKGDLFAFSRAAGKQTWRVSNFQRRLPTTPLAIGRAVAVGDFEGYVHFVDRDTGKTIARTSVGSAAFSSPPQNAGADQLLVQSRKGNLALISVQ